MIEGEKGIAMDALRDIKLVSFNHFYAAPPPHSFSVISAPMWLPSNR